MFWLTVWVFFIFWLLWKTYHKLIRPWLHKLNGKITALQIPDEEYYGLVAKEIRAGNIREGMWANAWSEAGGDNTKAQAIYMKMRVAMMKSEAAKIFSGKDDSATADSVSDKPQMTIVSCPTCNSQLRVPLGKLLDVRCSRCGNQFRINTMS